MRPGGGGGPPDSLHALFAAAWKRVPGEEDGVCGEEGRQATVGLQVMKVCLLEKTGRKMVAFTGQEEVLRAQFCPVWPEP